MKRMPFERPTDYYDKRISTIDEELCALLKKRKDVSNNNPGYPTFELISNWSKKYDLYEDFLKSIFGSLINDEHFKPQVEPNNFLKHLPVLKSIEKNEVMYTVTFIRQFDNASVVQLNLDWNARNESLGDRPERKHYELFIDEKYNCRNNGGGGSTGHFTFNFVVSPSLPDDPSGLKLTFKEYKRPFKVNPTGLEIVMELE